jgi:hypothetical protein
MLGNRHVNVKYRKGFERNEARTGVRRRWKEGLKGRNGRAPSGEWLLQERAWMKGVMGGRIGMRQRLQGR